MNVDQPRHPILSFPDTVECVGLKTVLRTPFAPKFCGVLGAESVTKTASNPPHELDENRTSVLLNKFF